MTDRVLLKILTRVAHIGFTITHVDFIVSHDQLLPFHCRIHRDGLHDLTGLKMWSYLMDFIKQGENAGQGDLSIQAMTLLNKVIVKT